MPEKLIEYAPIIICCLYFFIQQRLFVTPEQLEKKHREISSENQEKYDKLKDDNQEKIDTVTHETQEKFDNLDKNYVTLSAYLGFREQVLDSLKDVKDGIDDIKNFLIKK